MSRHNAVRSLAGLLLAGMTLSACAVYGPVPAYPPGYYYAPAYGYPSPAYGSLGFYYGDGWGHRRHGRGRDWD